MMRASWADGPSAPYLYTPELLADWLGYPGADPPLAPAIYSDEGLVAFAAGLPAAGRDRRGARGGSSSRPSSPLRPRRRRRATASSCGASSCGAPPRPDTTASINYCADGEAMHRMIETGCRLLDLPLVRVKSFSYLVGTLAPASRAPTALRRARPARRLVDAAADRRRARRGDAGAAVASVERGRGGVAAVAGRGGRRRRRRRRPHRERRHGGRRRPLALPGGGRRAVGAGALRGTPEAARRSAGAGEPATARHTSVRPADGLRGRPAVPGRGLGALPAHHARVPDAVVRPRRRADRSSATTSTSSDEAGPAPWRSCSGADRRGREPFTVSLACGFEPLHLRTFLAAELIERLSARPRGRADRGVRRPARQHRTRRGVGAVTRSPSSWSGPTSTRALGTAPARRLARRPARRHRGRSRARRSSAWSAPCPAAARGAGVSCA